MEDGLPGADKQYGRRSFGLPKAKAGCLIILSVKEARAGHPWRLRVNGCIVRDGRQECLCNRWNRNLPDCRHHRGRGHCRNDSGVSLRDRRCRFQKHVWNRTAAPILVSVGRAKVRRATSTVIESKQNYYVVKRYHFTHMEFGLNSIADFRSIQRGLRMRTNQNHDAIDHIANTTAAPAEKAAEIRLESLVYILRMAEIEALQSVEAGRAPQQTKRTHGEGRLGPGEWRRAAASHRQQRSDLFAIRRVRHAANNGPAAWGLRHRTVCRAAVRNLGAGRMRVCMDRAGNGHRGNQACCNDGG